MTLLAGILSRRPHAQVHDEACKALKRLISRRSDDHISIFRDPRVCLVKLDVGAYGQPAYRVDPSGTVTMLAGEPLLRRDVGQEEGGGRARDLAILHQSWDKGDWTALRETQGVFCAVHYHPDTATLTLFMDKLGLRPLYYWMGDTYFVFAGALRVLTALPDVPKTMDVRGVTEIVTFGYSLGSRTPYHGIAAARPAEILRISETGVSSQEYWRWDNIPVSSRPEAELLQDVYAHFTAAVGRRLQGDTATVALLSGGLDSRCVVAALRANDVLVHTFNCSTPGTQDRVFGAEFANKAGTVHQELDVGVGHPEVLDRIAEAWAASENRQQSPPERPQLFWTGNDGSVSLGHLWLSPDVVSLLRAGNREGALDRFLRERRMAVLSRLLHPRIAPSLSKVLHAGMREEMNDLRSEDPGRDLYILLMRDNERKLFRSYLENVDLYRFEFQTPFLDTDFLESVLAIPLDLCYRHRFYTKWLKLFDPVVTSVPWQANPGAEPCPLPIPRGVARQWNAEGLAPSNAVKRAESLRNSLVVFHGKRSSDPILNRPYLHVVRFVHRLGLRDYCYALDAAATYHRYWRACDGEYVLPVHSTEPVSPRRP
jgi:asparagine synthetase B (glutamine-hydrolysing)